MEFLLYQHFVPVLILYGTPLVFGLWYINKQITARHLDNRVVWNIFLILMPIIALILFYFLEVRNKPASF